MFFYVKVVIVIILLVIDDYVYIGVKDVYRNGDFMWIISGRYVISVIYFGMLFGIYNIRLCGSFYYGKFYVGYCFDGLKFLC